MGTQAADRFKINPAAWRFNPFTAASTAIDKTENGLTVPVSSPNALQLLEAPRKDTPTSITVYCVDDAAYFTEVASAPNAGEFRVDYPDPDGYGTGLVQFNSGDAGKVVNVVYKATGGVAVIDYLQARMLLPAGSPSAGHAVAYDASGDPQWRLLKARYAWDRDVVYHASGEGESAALCWFKTESWHTVIKLNLQGEKLHQAHYTEQSAGMTDADGGHSHTGPSHTHDPGTLDGTTDDFNVGEGELIGVGIASMTGATAAAGTGSTSSQPDHSHAKTANTKTYPHAFKVYIDGVDRTAALLTAASMAAFGDGTVGHAFVTTGTGELDISAYVSGAGMHTVKVTEPTSGQGGRVLAYVECY